MPKVLLPLLFLCLLLLTPAARDALAQGQPGASSQARCLQLLDLWDRYAGNKGEGGGSSDIPRKSAATDCTAGRTDAGIRTLEDLLRRNGYAVPPQ